MAAVSPRHWQPPFCSVESEIKRQFDERFREFESTRLWKETACPNCWDLAGPNERTKRAFNRWNSKNLYLEAKIVREGNETIRDRVLERTSDPARIDGTCGSWSNTSTAGLRNSTSVHGCSPDNDDAFVFVGTQGFPFPSDAEEKIIDTFRKLQRELYGI